VDYLIDNEWGIAVTIVALLMILGIFGSALWFIFAASDTNRKFRWLQVLDRRNRKDGSRNEPRVNRRVNR
jgi:hypothetical protein